MAVDLNVLYHRRNKEPNLTQHEFMGQYVEALAYSLSVWDGHQQSMHYYKKLSWGGLEISSAYKVLPVNDKTAIQTAIQNERYGKSGAKGEHCN